MAIEKAVGLAVPSWEKTRQTVRVTLLRRVVGTFDGPWAKLAGVSPFTVSVGGVWIPGTTVVQLYSWNDDVPPATLALGAPLSDPITVPGTYTYCAVLEYLGAGVVSGGAAPGVTVAAIGVDLETGF